MTQYPIRQFDSCINKMKIRLKFISHIAKQSGLKRTFPFLLVLFHLAVFSSLVYPSRANADEKNMTKDSMHDFWNVCEHVMTPLTGDEFVRIRHFGQDARVADLLANLIAAGQKTGTFTSPWLFEGNPNEEPVPGGYTVVTDFYEKPRLLLRTTAVTTMAFDEISENETRLDGPAIRQLAVWREVHMVYFGRRLAKLDRIASPNMPVTVETFEVVCDYTSAINQTITTRD